jgi:hypothetical protein
MGWEAKLQICMMCIAVPNKWQNARPAMRGDMSAHPIPMPPILSPNSTLRFVQRRVLQYLRTIPCCAASSVAVNPSTGMKRMLVVMHFGCCRPAAGCCWLLQLAYLHLVHINKLIDWLINEPMAAGDMRRHADKTMHAHAVALWFNTQRGSCVGGRWVGVCPLNLHPDPPLPPPPPPSLHRREGHKSICHP